ncbi:pseudouridine synthase [Atractiella rhizophila]|nr:pseudouridine synthase [Atractiella rhizophila]
MPPLSKTVSAATQAHLAGRFLSPSPTRLTKALTANIIYHGSSFLVLAKDSESSIQAQIGSTQRQNWEKMINEAKKTLSLKTDPTPLSRLDKSVTGAILLSTSKQKTRHLSRDPESSTDLVKNYLAIVIGKPEFKDLAQDPRTGVKRVVDESTLEEEDTSKKKKKKVEVDESKIEWEVTSTISSDGSISDLSRSGKESRTVVRLLHSTPTFSLLHFRLLTGRKHQLRVQATAVLGTPILGDFKYSPHSARRSKDRNFQQVQYGFQSYYNLPQNRIFLHCYNVAFPIWEKSFVDVQPKGQSLKAEEGVEAAEAAEAKLSTLGREEPKEVEQAATAEDVGEGMISREERDVEDMETEELQQEEVGSERATFTAETLGEEQPSKKKVVTRKRVEVFLDVPKEFRDLCEKLKLELPRIDTGWRTVE